MIPSSFSYQRAGSVEEALSLAAEHGDDAKFLAGGHSLLPLMKLRLAAPEVIIDLGGLHDLSYVNDQGSYVAIGALTRHHDVEHSDVVVPGQGADRDVGPLVVNVRQVVQAA